MVYEYLLSFIKETANFFNEMAIYLVFGFLVAGVLHVFFPESIVKRHLGKGNLASVIKSTLFGIPLPLCSCGVVPVATSLKRSGASRGSVVSFLVTTPQIGADSFMLTYSLMGGLFAVARIIASIVTALISGILINLFDKEKENRSKSKESIETAQDEFYKRLKRIPSYVEYELLGSIANTLLIGILIAGAVGVLFPDNFFGQYLGSPFLSMLIMLTIGIPIYVCASASTPIAAALMMKGLAPGAALVFLLSGPATNAVNLSTVMKILGKKSTAIYLISIAGVSLSIGYGFNLLTILPEISDLLTVHQHDWLPGWLRLFGSFTLLFMLGLYYLDKIRLSTIWTKGKDNKMGKIVLAVNGMTCMHCAKNVERAVVAVEDTSEVKVHLQENCVEFELSDEKHLDQVKQSILEAGYEL